MFSHRFEGRCHCGNLGCRFEASASLGELGLRACLCAFCRAHGARTVSDPKGRVLLAPGDPGKLIRYRFGLRTADFLVCGECGVYLGAVMSCADGSFMTVNANTFRPPPPPDFPLAARNLEAEDTESRIARRRATWTPVVESLLP